MNTKTSFSMFLFYTHAAMLLRVSTSRGNSLLNEEEEFRNLKDDKRKPMKS